MSKLPNIRTEKPNRPQTYNPVHHHSTGLISKTVPNRPLTHKSKQHIQQKTQLFQRIKSSTSQVNNGSLEIMPNEVVFRDIETNIIYEMLIVVRNLHKQTRKVKVVQPQLSKFKCDYDANQGIPAGLTMNLIVQFETNIQGEFHDQLRLVTDDNVTYNIPLHAYDSTSDIRFQQSLNFGFIQSGKEIVKEFEFMNVGNKIGKVELKVLQNSKSITIFPNSFNLEPRQKEKVKFAFKSYENGIFMSLIQVVVEDYIYNNNITVNATVIDYNQVIIDKSGGEIKQLDFGNIYFGERKEIETNIVNNSPDDIKFKIKLKNGQLLKECENLMTPNETGLEQSQKVISCYPIEGMIKAYSQTPILFRCKTRVNEEIQLYTSNYAASSKDVDIKSYFKDYTYTALFEFDGNDQTDKTISLFLQSKAVCPQIRLDKYLFEFDKCKVNQKKDMVLMIQNNNDQQNIDLYFQQIPYFYFSPNRLTLQPSEETTIMVSFRPKNLGRFNNQISLYLMNNNYKVQLKVNGICNELEDVPNNKANMMRIQSGHPKIRGGIEYMPMNVETQRNFVTDNQKFEKESDFNRQQIEFKLDDEDNIEQLRENRDVVLIDKFNKQKYNNYIVESRKTREKKRIQSAIHTKLKVLEDRKRDVIQTASNNKTQIQKQYDETEPKVLNDQKRRKPKTLDEDQMGEAPQEDYIRTLQNERLLISVPKMNLNKQKDPLYVTKAIQNYEPKQEKQIQEFKPKSNQLVRKLFSEEVRNYAEQKDINKVLGEQELQKIFAGPKIVDYETIFIKSMNQRTFWIKNDLKHSISARIECEYEELKQSDKRRQIIPSGQTAGFTLAFKSNKFQQFKGIVKYILNESQVFNFQVKANVEPVILEPNSTNLKFQFNEGNNEMTANQTLIITNNGKSDGKFSFQFTDQKIFKVFPKEGVVSAKSQFECMVTYKPGGKMNNLTSQQQNNVMNEKDLKVEEEKIVMKIQDGEDIVIRCLGMINEAKCQLKEKTLDLGQITICEKVSSTIWIKNKDKFSAIYQIDQDSVPAYTEIYPMKGKLNPDQMIGIKVYFQCKEEVEIKQEIKIELRGGQPLTVDFSVQTIIPNIRIEESEFDFGEVTTLGNHGCLKMTIVNQSSINCMLALDLRETAQDQLKHHGYECLDIRAVQQQSSVNKEKNEKNNVKDDDNSIVMSVDLDRELDLLNQKNVDDMADDNNDMVLIKEDYSKDDSSMDVSEFEDKDKQQKVSNRTYKLKIKPASRQCFEITFRPKEVKVYRFELPLSLFGYGKLDVLTRMIRCEGLKPKFLIEPKIMDFKKKIIRNMEKSIASFIEVALNNPNLKTIFWKIDTSHLENDNIFQICPNQGRIDGGQTIIIRASFNPYMQGFYEERVPVYIDENYNKSLMEIVLKGQGSEPRLLFDRKEVILPVVPLNIQSKCTFRILNDGYENLSLNYQINKEFGDIGLELDFIEGKNLGITKNKIKVEAKFYFKRSISFSVPVEFYDDQNRTFQIIVSGTTDNCLLTNYQFIQRNGLNNDYQLRFDENNQIQYMETETVWEETEQIGSQTTKQKDILKNKTQNSMMSSQNNHINLLGYHPIQQQMLERSADFLLRWLNHNVLLNAISNFPQDIIQSNGNQLFELVAFLTGRNNFPYRKKIDLAVKKSEKIRQILAQYTGLINELKEYNALLNTIRPCYLLSYQDYSNLNKKQNANKYSFINEKNFNYLSYDNWITLFYQILRVFYLSKIGQKSIKSIPNYENEHRTLSVQDCYTEGSNIVGQPEGILLRWLEANLEIHRPSNKKDQRTILNMETDLKDCIIYAYCIYNYVGQSVKKYINNMRKQCMNEEDYRYNGEKLISLLNEIGLQTNLQLKDLITPNSREQLLFISQLYHSLPHYQPRSDPIVFSCCLMDEVQKNIELINNSNKMINYWVKYEGSADFIKESDNVSIKPKSVYKYKVRFVSRISKQVTGRLTFTNKKDSNAQAAALVFELQSDVKDRKSIQKLQVKGKMYAIEEVKLNVKNIFSESNQDFATFDIQVINIRNYEFDFVNNEKEKQAEQEYQERLKQQKFATQKNKVKKKDVIKNYEDRTLPAAFYCPKNSVRIRKGQSTNVVIQYMPFSLSIHKCKVVFCDQNVGEFQYEIIGEAILPDHVGEIKLPFQLNVETSYNYEYQMNFKNELMINALKTNENRIRLSQKVQDKEELIKMNQETKPETQIEFALQIQPANNQIVVPPNFMLHDLQKALSLNFNKQVKTQQTKSTEQDYQDIGTNIDSMNNIGLQQQTNSNQNASNKLVIQFLFKSCFKDSTFFLVCTNQNKTDIRVFKMVLSVYPRPVKAQLEMRVPVGEEVSQDIPIINNSDIKDWVMKVQWINEQYPIQQQMQTSENSSIKNELYFHGSKELIVKKKSTQNYTIQFKPQQICQQKCKLVISNPNNYDQFEYDLVGIGEEPLAQDHVVIECIAGQQTEQVLVVHNPYADKNIVYIVDSDLQCFESNVDKITIKAGQKHSFKFKVHPKLGGIYGGSISFIEQENLDKYQWYTFVVNAERPRNEQQIDLITQVRKPVIFEIIIKNPLDVGIIYDVAIQGDYLSGNHVFPIEPNSENTYELMFSPLKEFQDQGTVAFTNEKMGELWYMLNLSSEKSANVRLPTLKSEIGKTYIHPIILENPSNKEVQVQGTLSNQFNFELQPQQTSIAAYSEQVMNLIYMPSEIDKTQQTDIIVKSEQIGEWYFTAFGQGTIPTQFETKEVHGQLNNAKNDNIVFRNPFKDSIVVQITMECDDQQYQDDSDKEIFELLLQKKQVHLMGSQVINIPFVFRPTQISNYGMTIIVFLSESIQWKYPIKGVTESFMNNIVYNLQTKARISHIQDIQIHLPGLPNDDQVIKSLTFQCKVQNIPEALEKIVSKDLQIINNKKQLDHKQDYLVYNLKFNPMKPYVANNLELLIDCEQGGRWKYRLNLESLEPNSDDTICIESPLNKTSSVSFKLNNKIKEFSQFKAYFTKDSDPEFTVIPQEGELEPLGREPKNFILSFTPQEYGKNRQAKLIIETENIYWSFIIKGMFPQYKPPDNLQAKVDDRLQLQVANQWQEMKKAKKKNFLKQNIKKKKE